MADVTSIALSGAQAQAQRLLGSASNVANVRTTGPLPGSAGATAAADAGRPYQPVETVQSAVAGPDGQGMGTRAVFKPTAPAYIAEYQPDSADADADGMVAAPNVDLAGERVQQTVAQRAYEANLLVLKAQDRMQREAVNTLA